MLFLFALFSCNEVKTDIDNSVKKSTTENNTDMFKSKVIVILSQDLDKDSKTINIQDYIENGQSYIPVFTTENKFAESTQGVDIGKQKIAIEGILLLSVLNGNERLRINPGLTDEQYLNASDLIAKYKIEIETLKAKMDSLGKMDGLSE